MLRTLTAITLLLSSALINAATLPQTQPLTLDNYAQIAKEQGNGVYVHPFDDSETLLIIQDFNKPIPFSGALSEGAADVLRISAESAQQKSVRNRPSVIFLSPVFRLADDSNAYLLQFPRDSYEYRSLIAQWGRNDIVKFADEFIFLHEVFHAQNHKVSGTFYDVRTREGLSDIAAVLVLIDQHQLSQKDAVKLARSMYHLRSRAAETVGNYSHFAKDELLGFIEWMKKRPAHAKPESFMDYHLLAMSIIGLDA